MIKVLFICHGNICRSTMAESVMTHLINQHHLSHTIQVSSAATSREEIGNPPHYGTVRKLREVNIPLVPHRAVQMTKRDYEEYDYTGSTVTGQSSVTVITTNISSTDTLDETDKEVGYGHGSRLQMHKNGKWKHMSVSIAVSAEEIILSPKSEHKLNENWSRTYGKLPKGKYRYIIGCNLDDGPNVYLACEFEIE